MRSAFALTCAILLSSCADCGDHPCAGSIVARAALRGFVGPSIVEACIDDGCTSTLLDPDACVDAVGGLPFDIEVCRRSSDADSGEAELTLVAGARADSVSIPPGAEWAVIVRSVDGALVASASAPATFTQRDECETTCLAGVFDLGTLDASAR